jgi:phosphate transport system permease protein
MGRVAGETAPILFTACVFVQRFEPFSIFSPDGMLRPVGALTFHLYTLWLSYNDVEFQAGGTALTLLLVVLAFYAIAFIIRSYYNKKRDW